MHNPIAYTYEADYHCKDCTEKRFGCCNCGFIACPGGGPHCTTPAMDVRDNEGNEVGVIAPWDEWTHGERGAESLVCGDCENIIKTADCAYCGADDCKGDCAERGNA